MGVKVTAENFHNRSHALSYQPPFQEGVKYGNLCVVDEENGLFYENNAITKIRNWQTLSDNSNSAFMEAVEALNVLLEYSDHEAITKTQCQYLLSEIAKVKDATALKNSLKRKLSMMKNASSAKSAIKKKLRSPLQNMINPAKPGAINPPKNPGVATQPTKNAQPPVTSSNINSKREALIEDCYQSLIDEATRCYECDRIKENYENVAKRFKIDNIFNEHVLGKRSLYDAAYSTASCVSSFSAPFKNIYNTALETCWYVLNKKHIRFNPELLIEGVTDYFVFNGGLSESELKDAMEAIEFSPIFESSNHIPVKYISRARNIKKPEKKTTRFELIRSPSKTRKIDKVYGESDVVASLVESLTDLPSEPSKVDKIVDMKSTFDEEVDIKNLIADFRAQCSENDSPTSNLIILQSLVDYVVKNCPTQIPIAYKKLLDICRMSFVIYSQSSSVDEIIRLNDKLIKTMRELPMNAAQTDKIIGILNTEIGFIQNRIDRLNGMDESSQLKLYKYIKSLRVNLDQLKEYKDIVKQVGAEKTLSAEEIKALNLKEAGKILLVYDLLHGIIESTENKDATAIIIGNVSKIPLNAVDAVIDYTNTSPSVLNKQKLREELINHRNALRSGLSVADGSRAQNDFESSAKISDYIKIDQLNEAIDALDTPDVYDGKVTLENTIITLMCLDELLHMATDSKGSCFNEQYVFIDTMKALTDDIKNKTSSVSVDEKLYSTLLDNQINHIIELQSKGDTKIEPVLLTTLSKSITYGIRAIGQSWVRNALSCIIKAVEEFFCHGYRDFESRQNALMTIEDCISEINSYYERLIMSNSPLELYNPDYARRSLRIILDSLNGAYNRINFKLHYDVSKPLFKEMI